MLIPFSADSAVNLDGWKGQNWRNSGYDIYAYFPTFPANPKDDPKGTGDFEVDYQDTLADFNRITGQLKPSLIISYGLHPEPVGWKIERFAKWYDEWNGDYLEPTQPQQQQVKHKIRRTTLPVKRIENAVLQAVPELHVWVDEKTGPGKFLCNYIAYLDMQYQHEHRHCKAAGFIHVGADVDAETASRANEAVLEAVLFADSDI